MVNNIKTLKLALGVEYDGTRYYGWQSQKGSKNSIQETLSKAVSKIANHDINLFCAGRTDSGVHSTGQVVHFTTTSYRTNNAWTLGINSNLPYDISIRWAQPVPDLFHSRFSAKARRYRYIIYNNPQRPAILNHGLTHFYHLLNIEKMLRASRCLIGEHDFTSFRAIQCQSSTPWRNIMYLNIIRQGPYVMFDIKANAFVHHMVRNIVGSLIQVGCSNQSEDWIAILLAAKDRTLASVTAKANGLYLVSVEYPRCFSLPKTNMGPLFFID
ncbi:tRNA pseudouridine(38-40) synthase TruA [Pantoea sp. Mhis]|uniref:tRNA pseudouridine(38-40) synthase TruA n=1 Tax=Pantoea sp. Mhis TaxID=2576759 RepID=UPI00135C672E|nr:tRNA pseudouridine(38-40) synthase TruA [Pantoea sp. Mhis]MXP56085.1 tRNA pseudouridine(38-40) synthase TruA [Pantoea sp. Mhis]